MPSTPDFQLTRRDLVFSLALTTLLTLAVSCGILFLARVNIVPFLLTLMAGVPSSPADWALIFFAPAIVIAMEWLLFRYVPRRYWFEPINDQLAQKFSLWELALIFAMSSVSEELLFRGVLQNLLGFRIATLLFVVIHVRYLKRALLLLVTFILACVLGGVYLQSGSLWVVILCHFLLNMGVITMLKSGKIAQKS